MIIKIIDKKISETELREIAYISLINIRPKQGNLTMEVQNESLRDKMREIILKYLS